MKNVKKVILAVVMAVGILTGSAYAEEPKVTGFASVDLMSNYVWRGIKSTPGMAVQPSVGISYGSFSTNLWANYDAKNSEHTETDLTMDYGFSFDKVALNLGYIYYAFEGLNDTQEFYVALGYDTILKPKLTVYYDFDEGDGVYIVASVGHSFELAKDIPLNLGASASYNINNKIMGSPDGVKADFSDFYIGELTASVGIPVAKNISITPKIAYSLALSDDAKTAIKGVNYGDSSSILYGGVNLTLSF
jgi:hypothetical protein